MPSASGCVSLFSSWNDFSRSEKCLGYVLDPWVWAENSIRLKIISNLRVGSPQFRWWSYIGFSQNKLAIHIKMALHSKLLEGPADLLHPPWIHKTQLSFVNYFPKSFGIENATPFRLNYWSREYDTQELSGVALARCSLRQTWEANSHEKQHGPGSATWVTGTHSLATSLNLLGHYL